MRSFVIQLEEHSISSMTLTEDEAREMFPGADFGGDCVAGEMEDILYADHALNESTLDYLRERSTVHDSALRAWQV